ncbi:MAG: arginine--tRNA ligase [Sphaerochaeta sp.]|jgi:arginyl-tRNA synthetase|nr:arginine--tRNA ligase [Sphaerochaeta sp.]
MLENIRDTWKSLIEEELALYAAEKVGDVGPLPPLVAQTPPKPELGDLAFPLFAYAKIFHLGPPALAQSLKERIEKRAGHPAGQILISGPYLNVKIDTASLATALAAKIGEEQDRYGTNDSLGSKRITIEFSCPNTNKPLHLGHMRNDSLGMSMAAILAANGATVRKVNLINNRGVHICKSMLAYQKFSEGETPESSGIKGDHLVGNYYVKFAQWAKEDPTAEAQAQAMLKAWEEGDSEVLELWQRMNDWTMAGLYESYESMGISFDAFYWESETYKYGKDEILKGLENGVFYREEDGSVWVDLTRDKLDKKVLLRSDGTSLYITQDVGTAIMRHKDWPFDAHIYVVGSEQQYHFKVLFRTLQLLGYSWAENLHHLSYGMVNLPEGKMKSREGTVVDADELLSSLSALAEEEIRSKGREGEVGDLRETSRAIALGALNYYLLQVTSSKDMIFNPAESISFNGNTGPYLQYMGARISSMLAKFHSESPEVEALGFDASLLSLSDERELVKLLARYPEVVAKAGDQYDPSLVTAYLYELSKLFSRYYHDNPVLKAPSPELVRSRIELVRMVNQVLKNAFALVGIPYLASM